MSIKKLLTFLFLISIISFQSAAKPFNTTALATLPPTIGSYKVLVTFPPGATACTPQNTTRIVLQATETSARAHLKNSRVQLIRQDLHQLPNWGVVKYQISIVGPKATIEEILQNNADWNSVRERSGCRKLNPLATYNPGDEIQIAAGQAGRAVFENVDAGSYPSGGNSDNAQSVYLTAPTSIDNNNTLSVVLNNVYTDENYLLQNGLQFIGTTGQVVWTSESQEYYPQIIEDVPYVAGHQYWFVISYGFEVWQLCQYDIADINTYTCIFDNDGRGNNLKYDYHTGIWFENFNTNSNWADNFPTLEIHNAEIYINGFNQHWSTEHKHTLHACGTPPLYPTSTAMSGSLVNGGTGYFYPVYLPLYC